MPVKGLTPDLIEVGKIKIGGKGEEITSQKGTKFRPPVKFDHFEITNTEKNSEGDLIQDSELVERLRRDGSGAIWRDGNLIGIPVNLLYNDPDLNFPTRYASYMGGRLFCSGDGEAAQRIDGQQISCPCKRLDPGYSGADKCKVNGTLRCMVRGSDYFGGCHVFRTTSMNTCRSILGSMAAIRMATGGMLAFLPLHMIMKPKSTVTPGGQPTTIHVVSIVYHGDVADLQRAAIEMAGQRQGYLIEMNRIEAEAKCLPAPFSDDDTVAEFYPDAACSGQDELKSTEEEETKNESGHGEDQGTGKEETPETVISGRPEPDPAPDSDVSSVAEDRPEPEDQAGQSGEGDGGDAEAEETVQEGTEVDDAQGDAQAERAEDPQGKSPGADGNGGGNAGSDNPFGGKKDEIVSMFKKGLMDDQSRIVGALAKARLNVPPVEIQNILKSPKWDDVQTWAGVFQNYCPATEKAETLIVWAQAAIEATHFKRDWTYALGQCGVGSAKELTESNVADFIRIASGDVPF